MPTIPPRFLALRNTARVAAALLSCGALAAIIYGVYAWTVLNELHGVGFLAGGVAALALGLTSYASFSLAHKAASNTYRSYDVMLEIAEQLRRQTEHMHTIAENSALSDWSKRIVYREKDYEFLRDTIHAAFVRQDWIAAERLIRELDEEFGLSEEAAAFREDLARARQATTGEKIAAAQDRFEALCESRKWDQAKRETDRLRSLFPDEPRIAAMQEELELRQKEHKRSLLQAYEVAVENDDVNTAHRLLFELDQHLAPAEAAALKESARGVFKAQLQQMGVQFSLAVTEHNFPRAINIGNRIIREFPNSRFAREITRMLPTLRQRVTQETSARGSK